MNKEKRPQSTLTTSDGRNFNKEAGCLYALITGKRPVSRRNRASWYLNQLNKIVKCDAIDSLDDDESPPLNSPNVHNDTNKDNNQNKGDNEDINHSSNKLAEKDIRLISITSYQNYNNQLLIGNQNENNRQFDNRSINLQANYDSRSEHYLVTPNTRVLYLSRSIATSIILDLSPSVVSVSSQNGCVFLDSMFDAVKRVLHLLVSKHEIPTSSLSKNDNQRFVLEPKVFVSVIAYTPFVVAKSNQVLIQNRRICLANIEQVLVEIWICLNRLTQEIYDLVSSTCGINNYDLSTTSSRNATNVFVFPPQSQVAKLTTSSAIIRPPGSVLEDIFELGLFSSSLMPRLSRLSVLIISDGLFSSTNNLSIFRLKSIAVSFVSLGAETACNPDGCFGYTPYVDLMKFISKTTLGVYLSHQDLLNSSHNLSKLKQIPFLSNPLGKLFCWTLHSELLSENQFCDTPLTAATTTTTTSFSSLLLDNNNKSFTNQSKSLDQSIEITSEHITRYFCVDQPLDALQPSMGNNNSDKNINNNNCMENTNNYHDWRSFRQLDRNLDADFEQVLACLLREGYLIKNIQFKHKESTKIVARLVLHWRHNLDLEQELTAPCWNNTNPFGIQDNNNHHHHQLMQTMRQFNTPQYGDTYCEVIVHGSYSFLHNLYCDRRSTKRRSEFRDISYRQYRQLIDSVMQTQERLQYLSKFYRDSSLSKVPSFLLHGNSLLYEQPHTHRLTSTIENVLDETKTSDFQEYWQKISCLDTKSWKNLMHIHTLRLVLEHDQPKYKNIHYQNANGRYTHVQCRRALSAISNFIKTYSSFALLEDTTYIKFIYNKDDDLREIETSATKGFIVIRINKLLPIVVIYLMFTSGILDSHRIKIVSYLENQLTNCKLRNIRSTSVTQLDNILKSKTIYPSGEACCILLRSPLERMLKVYSRNFVNDFLIHNLAHGLPGSCPHILSTTSHQSIFRPNNNNQSISNNNNNNNNNQSKHQTNRNVETQTTPAKDSIEGYSPNSSINQYNLIFGKYLYGFRTVQTITNLPNDLLTSLASNVLSKISAILVNMRIKQGFHIAFNNSGILNLVVELSMKDYSNEDNASSCLCQYIVFPPTVTSHHNQTTSNSVASGSCASSTTLIATSNVQSGSLNTVLNGYNNFQTGSRPNSLSGSLTNNSNIDNYIKTAGINNQENNNNNNTPNIRNINDNCSINNNINNFNGEIKIIKEYWIEQQYGTSSENENYHKSLENMRYSEVVDHLFITDSNVFECLLTYDLLQLMCDKLSLYYDLDLALSHYNEITKPQSSPLFSPISTTTSSSLLDQQDLTNSNSYLLPSTLIEGNTKDGNSRVPLLEMIYKFSIMKFLDNCQQASLNVLLFKDYSEFGSSISMMDDEQLLLLSETTSNKSVLKNNKINQEFSNLEQQKAATQLSRKMSVDTQELEFSGEFANKREHRCSYQHDNYYTYTNPIYSPSLNHMFLETLHRRLKQMHDKELKLSDFDLKKLPLYLKNRKLLSENNDDVDDTIFQSTNINPYFDSETIKRRKKNSTSVNMKFNEMRDNNDNREQEEEELINWRCFLRKGNQENLMIVLVPATLSDISKWLNFINNKPEDNIQIDFINGIKNYDPVCPIFVFRCSSTMINDHVMSFLNNNNNQLISNNNNNTKCSLESDISLHLGQPCKYMGKLKTFNDELSVEILPLIQQQAAAAATTTTNSDEKTLEIVHFRAFLRKIKNTVLKSRFSSLNDAYLSELFIHKDDILYYINNVDFDTQKKYHVSSQLKSLAEFIKNYQDYSDSLPKEPKKQCNQLLNSILLQKCGLFINQPIARFNESNPLMKQMHDKKLLFLMRSNYKIELPILEESLASSTLLKNFVKFNSSTNLATNSNTTTTTATTTSVNNNIHHNQMINLFNNNSIDSSSKVSTSLGKSTGDGFRYMEMKCGSLGTPSGVNIVNNQHVVGSPSNSSNFMNFSAERQQQLNQVTARFGSNTTLNSFVGTLNENVILEAFRGLKSFPIREINMSKIDINDIALRHEAHMAEVLMRFGERKESHHYRRVLKSKGNYNQSHGAIDQALKRVDSLGRLEHFCLTPLLFSPNWRSKLAPVRDHTIESNSNDCEMDHYENSFSSKLDHRIIGVSEPKTTTTTTNSKNSNSSGIKSPTLSSSNVNSVIEASNSKSFKPIVDINSLQASAQQDADERWHIMVCNNYIKEYEQYIQTLGFNSVQIRYQSSNSTTQQQQQLNNDNSTTMTANYSKNSQNYYYNNNNNSPTKTNLSNRKETTINTQQLNNSATYNTGYLIKFLNSGCLVFKVGFCKPYVYSILYSIEGERFNNSNIKLNMTTFLDELDNIKVTMHLHSFTYDYHLRSMYSYISGRQLTFSPGYHLISFLDDFRKYYQKAPNYARNHILSGEISISNIKVGGQQLYNYIVTHNSIYNMEVLEMNSSISGLISDLSNRQFISSSDQQNELQNNNNLSTSINLINQSNRNNQIELTNANRNHANDYVLIELKREKVRYRDGKDPDIFDCGLLITHDFQQTNQSLSKNNNSLTLKYFLLLTNQRDLYPKLIHTYDNIISTGCHRPIRLGLATQQQEQSSRASKLLNNSTLNNNANDQTSNNTINNVKKDNDNDEIRSSELLSSCELSGPLSIQSTTNSTQSSTLSTGLQFNLQAEITNKNINLINEESTIISNIPKINLEYDQQVQHASNEFQSNDLLSQTTPTTVTLKKSTYSASNLSTSTTNNEQVQAINDLSVSSSNEDNNNKGSESDDKGSDVVNNLKLNKSNVDQQQQLSRSRRDRNNSTGSSRSKKNFNERTICDEEITYLGYFSSDEMDVLKFLQQKTNNLRNHIEEIVKLAEIHYRRDSLWQKLMQRNPTNNKNDDFSLTNDELIQLLSVVEAIDLAVLDPQLLAFTTMHINWYLKLIKAFSELKQSSSNQHRIYTVKASKLLLLYIDPKCTSSFILLTIDQEKGSVELSMLLKNKQECSRVVTRTRQSGITASSNPSTTTTTIDLDNDCQQLINDFINFCATFMWSTFLISN